MSLPYINRNELLMHRASPVIRYAAETSIGTHGIPAASSAVDNFYSLLVSLYFAKTIAQNAISADLSSYFLVLFYSLAAVRGDGMKSFSNLGMPEVSLTLLWALLHNNFFGIYARSFFNGERFYISTFTIIGRDGTLCPAGEMLKEG